jgi:hypothetical protein
MSSVQAALPIRISLEWLSIRLAVFGGYLLDVIDEICWNMEDARTEIPMCYTLERFC